MKYKIGDKVKVREDLVEGKVYGEHMFINDMAKFKGKEAIIRTADDYNRDYMLGGSCFMWTDEMIEGLVEEISKESIPKFKIGDKVELISVDEYDQLCGLKIGDIGIITKIMTDVDNAYRIDFKKVSYRTIYYKQIKLVEEYIIIKPKYVKCTTSKFDYINKNEVCEVVSEFEDTYAIKTSTSEFPRIYSKYYFVEETTPKSKSTKGVIKYKIKGDVTTVKLNGKVGKATRNSIDEPDNKIGILIGLCRALCISETKIQDIIDVLFDSEDTKAKYGCENAVMKNDITRALSILDKYRE